MCELVHSSGLLLHAQLLGEGILNGRMYMISKNYPSVIRIKPTHFEGCLVDIIYHAGSENALANFTCSLWEQPGFIQSTSLLVLNLLLMKSFVSREMFCKGYKKKKIKKHRKSLCKKDSYHTKHNAADNVMLSLRSDSHYLYYKHRQTHMGVHEILSH